MVDRAEPVLDVERFQEGNPGINASLLLELVRVALRGASRASPVGMTVHTSGETLKASVAFQLPDERSVGTLQPNEFVEKGAIVISGLVLNWLETRQITHVAEVGSRVDYFIGREPGDRSEILEVSGTWDGEVEPRLKKKHAQFKDSPWVRPPYRKTGWVAVTRFAEPAKTVLERGHVDD